MALRKLFRMLNYVWMHGVDVIWDARKRRRPENLLRSPSGRDL